MIEIPPLPELLATLAAAPDAPEPAPAPAPSSWLDYSAPPRDANEALAEYCHAAPLPPVSAAQQAAIVAGLARQLAAQQIAAQQAAQRAQDRALLRVLLSRDVTPRAPIRECEPRRGYEWWRQWWA